MSMRKHKSKQLGKTPSRAIPYKCMVPEYDTAHRKDNLKKHYTQFVDEKSLTAGC